MSTLESKSKLPRPQSQRTPHGWGARSNHIAFDPEYAVGARNAVNVCLRVQPEEKVCVITDEATLEIAAAIVSELERLGRRIACGFWRIWRSDR